MRLSLFDLLDLIFGVNNDLFCLGHLVFEDFSLKSDVLGLHNFELRKVVKDVLLLGIELFHELVLIGNLLFNFLKLKVQDIFVHDWLVHRGELSLELIVRVIGGCHFLHDRVDFPFKVVLVERTVILANSLD